MTIALSESSLESCMHGTSGRQKRPRRKRRRCKLCHQRRAEYVYRGRRGGDKGHDLCMQCWKKLTESKSPKKAYWDVVNERKKKA